MTAGLVFAAPVGALSADQGLRAFAEDVNAAVGAATSTVGALQSKINDAGLPASEFAIEDLVAAMRADYGRRTGRVFGGVEDERAAAFHRTLESAMREVLGNYEGDILKGGQDAFVPAFFRAEMLMLTSQDLGRAFDAVVTTRDDDLINEDSGVDEVFLDAVVAAHVSQLVETGHGEVAHKEIDGRLVSYFPMTLSDSCVSCHLRSGLEQQVGGFGGALVVSIAEPQ